MELIDSDLVKRESDEFSTLDFTHKDIYITPDTPTLDTEMQLSDDPIHEVQFL